MLLQFLVSFGNATGRTPYCLIEGTRHYPNLFTVLAGQTAKRILIVTSDYHTRRALSIFRHELPGRSFSVAAAYDPAEFGTLWWTHRQWAKILFDEWIRLVWWNAVDRWR